MNLNSMEEVAKKEKEMLEAGKKCLEISTENKNLLSNYQSLLTSKGITEEKANSAFAILDKKLEDNGKILTKSLECLLK